MDKVELIYIWGDLRSHLPVPCWETYSPTSADLSEGNKSGAMKAVTTPIITKISAMMRKVFFFMIPILFSI